jgi:predicted DsbA family dithiol-disulfide isomerase
MKGKLSGWLMTKSPTVARITHKYFELISWVFAIAFLVSAVYSGIAVYNLVRYQTCDPNNGNCPVGAKACAEQDAGSFWAGLVRLFGGSKETVENAVAGPAKKESVELVEYADFQCPACAMGALTVEETLKKFGSKVNFTFKHFPLSQHKWATQASWAAEAAKKQGKFFEMYLRLYAHQSEWSTAENAPLLFEKYAEELGLDISQYKKDYASDDVRDKVESDRSEALKEGIQATPTFKIDGVLKVGLMSPEEMAKEIEERLK